MATSLYAGLLGLFYLIISIDVIIGRIRNKISLGPGKNNEILRTVSAHDNFAAYTPIFLILLYFFEQYETHVITTHLLGSSFLLGRFFHYIGLSRQRKSFLLRRTGMILTFVCIIILSLYLVLSYKF